MMQSREHRRNPGLPRACLLLALLAAPACGGAQAGTPAGDPGSPAWVVEMFYAHPSFPELAKHVTGEYAAHYAGAATMGSRLPKSVAVTSRPLRMEAERAVFATSLRDAAHAEDWYTFLRRENGVWKIEAVRTLALPPLVYMLLDSLQEARARGVLPDSLVALAETIRLETQSDSALKAHLLAHQPALRALAERFGAAAGLTGISVDGNVQGRVPDAERRALAAALRAQRLSGIMRSPGAPGCVFLEIGGMLDNRVGYIYAPAGCTPPPLSPGEYIYVEAVAPGWYLYKTT